MVELVGTKPWKLKSTTIASPLADQTTRRIVAELGKNARSYAREEIWVAIWRMLRGIEVTVWHYRLKTSLTLIRFYLIGYWRLNGNATSSTLCQHR